METPPFFWLPLRMSASGNWVAKVRCGCPLVALTFHWEWKATRRCLPKMSAVEQMHGFGLGFLGMLGFVCLKCMGTKTGRRKQIGRPRCSPWADSTICTEVSWLLSIRRLFQWDCPWNLPQDRMELWSCTWQWPLQGTALRWDPESHPNCSRWAVDVRR